MPDLMVMLDQMATQDLRDLLDHLVMSPRASFTEEKRTLTISKTLRRCVVCVCVCVFTHDIVCTRMDASCERIKREKRRERELVSMLACLISCSNSCLLS